MSLKQYDIEDKAKLDDPEDIAAFLDELTADNMELDSPILHADDAGALLERAWVLLANAGNGNWDTETKRWKASAESWRDDYHNWLDARRFEEADEREVFVGLDVVPDSGEEE